MVEYVMPKRLVIEESREDKDYYYARFVLSPLERGYAVTIGNALRRVLLSSIPSLAITKLKIPDKYHEYDTIDGVKEDIIEIILNLKKVQLRSSIPVMNEVKLIIDKKGPADVKAGDIMCPAGVEVMNPEQHIATLNESATLYMEIFAEMGKGYVPVAEREEEEDIQMIPIDGVFSPVVKVNFLTENVRVGKRTDYDKLILEVWTKKSVKPVEAVKKACNILSELLDVIKNSLGTTEEVGFESFVEISEEGREKIDEKEEGVESKVEEELMDTLLKSIDELELSARSLNSLKRDKIMTIGELIERKPEDLLKIKNFGKKSLQEVREKLWEKFGLKLKEDNGR
ncbi:MAG TPA: DNA-directed RNA polymerase subunit alpha [Thermotogales bacterium]|nr:DNA-directed RNA polymerase subunit alpha [Thermotogales bacterium]